jgi:hypothetical protein
MRNCHILIITQVTPVRLLRGDVPVLQLPTLVRTTNAAPNCNNHTARCGPKLAFQDNAPAQRPRSPVLRPSSPVSTSPGGRAVSFRSLQLLDHNDKAAVASNEESIKQQVMKLQCWFTSFVINRLHSAFESGAVQVCGLQRWPTVPLPRHVWTFTFCCACCFCPIVNPTLAPFALCALRTAALPPVCTMQTHLSA